VLLAPLAFTWLGALSNQVVLYVNHDTFPVRWNDYKIYQYKFDLETKSQSEDEDVALQAQMSLVALKSGYLDDTHVIMTKDTHLNLLADWFDLRGDGTYSIGDGLIYLGEWLSSFAVYVWGALLLNSLRKQE
jgi:hypothetical protein